MEENENQAARTFLAGRRVPVRRALLSGCWRRSGWLLPLRRLLHGRAAPGGRLRTPAGLRSPWLYVGQRLLLPGRHTLDLAHGLLGSAAVCRRGMVRPPLVRRTLLRRRLAPSVTNVLYRE